MNLNACEGCLSVNRSLKIVNENERKLFYNFINTNYSKDQLKLCWECRALLKKFLRFKLQVRKARDVLDSYVAHHTILNSLSSLQTTQCEHEIICSVECSQETPSLPSVKTEVDEDVQDFTAEKLFDNDGVDKEALINALRAEMDTIESELTDDKSDINGATSAVSETDTTFKQNQHINPSHSLHAKMDTIENETIENEKTEDIFGCSDEDPLHVTKVEKRIQIKRRISSYETTDDSDDESDINGATSAVSETDTTFKQNQHTTECKNEVVCSVQCKERENPSLISVKIEDDKDVVEDFSAANTVIDDDIGLMTNASHSLHAEMDTIENEVTEKEKIEDIFGCSDDDPLHVTKVEKRIQIRRRISSNETTDDSDDESDINGATSAVSETDTTFEQNQHTYASNSLQAEMDTIENETIENEKTEDIFGCSDDDSLLVVKVQKRIQIRRRISANETTDDSDDESDINGATSAVSETDTTFKQNQHIIASNSLNTEIDVNMDTSENDTIGNENDNEDLFDCSDDDPLNIKEKKRTSKIKRRVSSNAIERIPQLSKPQNGYQEHNTRSDLTSSDINVSSTKHVGFSTPNAFDNTPSIDIQQLHVPSTTTKLEDPAVNKSKSHFCPFCKKLQTKFSRHLLLKHADKDDVKKFLHLSKRSKKRKKIIASIRKRGDFLHNTSPEFNTGILIVPRQRKSGSVNSAEDYIPCKNCKLFLSKTSLRLHIPLCDKSHRKGSRTALRDGRRLAGYIHPCASETLRRTIFPVFKDDAIVRCIKYDEIIIKFGNKLCEQYTLTHQHEHIRAQLRLLGRLKVEMMILDETIYELMSVFDPKQFDNIIKSIKIIASWNEQIMWYDLPSVAQNLITLIKKCAKKLRVECIKSEDNNRKSIVENFLLLWEEKVPNIYTIINKKVLEDQVAQKRQKKAILPSKSDIKLLYDYLQEQCFICLEILTNEFRNSTWVLLIQSTLILVQIHNRRRAGEIERLTLIDYENKTSLNENVVPEIYNKLSENTRKYAAQYKRLTIRGGRGRMVPVLLSPVAVICIDLILKYRKEAKIASSNEYIFSKPNGSKLSKPYFRACPLMRRFANDCGALIPSALRGTTLRKHIATYIEMLNIEESHVDRLANVMGNNKDIHKNIYIMPVPVAEITDVSRLLMSAIGDDQEGNKASDEENSDSSDEDVNDGNDDPELNTHENTNKRKASHTLTFENGETCKRKKTEVADPHNCKTRQKWSDREREAVARYFGDILVLSKLPSLQECQTCINMNSKILHHRSAPQLKTWIDNQRRAKDRKEAYASNKKAKQL